MQRLDKHDISNYFIIAPQTELLSRACERERLAYGLAGRLAPDDASGGGFKKDMATPVTEYLFFPFQDRVKHIAGLEQQLKKLTAEEEASGVPQRCFSNQDPVVQRLC